MSHVCSCHCNVTVHYSELDNDSYCETLTQTDTISRKCWTATWKHSFESKVDFNLLCFSRIKVIIAGVLSIQFLLAFTTFSHNLTLLNHKIRTAIVMMRSGEVAPPPTLNMALKIPHKMIGAD